MHWGLSGAVDLQTLLEQDGTVGDGEARVLLLGCADGRHVLRTLAQSYRHAQMRAVALYVYEDRIELLARQMLLLSVALERRPVPEKARLFMELFGNAFLRPSTARYLAAKSRQLARIVGGDGVGGVLRLELLKHRTLDALEDVFGFWRAPANFDMGAEWDARLRRELGARYDAKDGVFDWDYYMRLKDAKDGERVAAGEYKQFRHNGVAFSWLETEYAVSNPTLAASVVREGRRLRHDGYRGDVRSGPFFAYGIATEHADLQRKSNGRFVADATAVTERNLRQLFHELEHRDFYEHRDEPGDSRRGGGVVITELTTVLATSDDTPHSDSDEPKVADLLDMPPGFSVHLVTTPSVADMLRKPSLAGHFDAVVIGQTLLHAVTPELRRVVKDGALLLVEGRKFLVTSVKQAEALREFEETLRGKAKDCGFEFCREFDPVKDEHALLRLCSVTHPNSE